MSSRQLAVMSLSISLWSVMGASAGAKPQRDQTREERVVAELSARAPLAVPLFRSATEAADLDQWAVAAAEYAKVLALAPDFDPALRRRGHALVKLGQRAEGLALQERAISVQRSAANLASLALTLFDQGKSRRSDSASRAPSSADLKRAVTLAGEAARLEPAEADYGALWAQAALQADDTEGLRQATTLLLRHHPDQMSTHYFAAVSAAIGEDWARAENEIREAGRLGLPQAAVDSFLAAGVGSRATAWRWAKGAGVVTALWALGLVGLFVVGKVLSSLTLAQIETDTSAAIAPPGVRRLRAVYRTILSLAGLYWYISLPFVAALVLAVSGSVIYGFLMAGRIPIKITAILVIGVLVTLYALVRSLFVRVREDSDPGRRLPEADAPGLWRMVREVARDLGTRPVDEIWLTPHTEVAVFERGSLRERTRDRARRALIVGTAILDGFDRNALRAVLAHEYGHFSHRDTAGGDVALRVRGGMFRFALALAQSGYAVWWNLAFQFLRVYDFIFRRISHGATRLQEVLADRVAIRRYGLDAFQAGLTHVIRRGAEFEHAANAEIVEAIASQRAMANLYTLPKATAADAGGEIEQQITARMNAPTSEDDTHPSPRDRFRLGSRIRSTVAVRDGGPVWELFRDPEALMLEMTQLVASGVATESGLQFLVPPGTTGR